MIDFHQITFISNQTFCKTELTIGTFDSTISKFYPTLDDYYNTYGNFISTANMYEPDFIGMIL